MMKILDDLGEIAANFYDAHFGKKGETVIEQGYPDVTPEEAEQMAGKFGNQLLAENAALKATIARQKQDIATLKKLDTVVKTTDIYEELKKVRDARLEFSEKKGKISMVDVGDAMKSGTIAVFSKDGVLLGYAVDLTKESKENNTRSVLYVAPEKDGKLLRDDDHLLKFSAPSEEDLFHNFGTLAHSLSKGMVLINQYFDGTFVPDKYDIDGLAKEQVEKKIKARDQQIGELNEELKQEKFLRKKMEDENAQITGDLELLNEVNGHGKLHTDDIRRTLGEFVRGASEDKTERAKLQTIIEQQQGMDAARKNALDELIDRVSKEDEKLPKEKVLENLKELREIIEKPTPEPQPQPSPQYPQQQEVMPQQQ